ncbi:hypothetical protein VB691_08435 [Crocosphaera sp. XPORK-15E]|nr:hypothetical protein [Crocosphaera sp. XPORK-15E]MEA5534033.1 hypothetical protein [Crocosphaera sp. XPORK-15E]
MSKTDLKAYVLTHRDDMEAIRHLFSRRQSDEDTKHYPPLAKDGLPIEENINIMKTAIQERLKETMKSNDAT